MTYLRFDTDRGRDTVARLRQVVENMRTESESTHSNINALVGSAWIAPAAYEFQSTDSELRQSIAATLERLTELSARLEAEIAEWEETAAVFGGGSAGIAVKSSPSSSRFVGGGGGAGGGSSGYRSKNYSDDHLDGVSSGDIPDGKFETHMSANFIKAEGEVDDAVYDKRFGDVEIAAIGVEAGGAASLGIGSSGLQGKAEGQASVYLGQVEVETTVAGVELAGEAQIGAQISGEGKVSLNPLDGDVGVEGEVGAFVGSSIEGQAKKDFGVAEVGAKGRVGYGLGVGANIDVGYSKGVIAVGAGAYAFLGPGVGGDFSFEIDVPEAVDSVVDIAENAIDIGTDIWHNLTLW